MRVIVKLRRDVRRMRSTLWNPQGSLSEQNGTHAHT